MKIAVIGHKRFPTNEGGIEKVVKEQAVRMAKLGHEVHVYNRKGHNVFGMQYDTEELKEYMGVKIITIPTFKRPAEVPVYSFLATIRAIFGKYDAVCYHGSGSCVMISVAKLFGCKCIGFLHGIDSQRDKWGGFASRYLRLGEKIAARKADACMVLSENAREYIKEMYGKKAYLFANGIDKPDKLELNIMKKRFGLEKDKYFLSLGRIVEEKGLHYLIEAYKQIDTDKKLVIAGGITSYSYHKILLDMAKGDDRIIFTNFVQGDEIGELYSNAYTYVMPSNLEGMANTLLEAMAHGNCCLFSDIPENSEAAGDKALYFRKGSIEDLKDMLSLIDRNPDIVEKYRKTAAEYILSRYNWDRVVEQLIEIFKGNPADYSTE